MMVIIKYQADVVEVKNHEDVDKMGEVSGKHDQYHTPK